MLGRMTALKTGLLLGAGAMYLLDRDRGEERRRDMAERLRPILENTTLAPLVDALDASTSDQGSLITPRNATPRDQTRAGGPTSA